MIKVVYTIFQVFLFVLFYYVGIYIQKTFHLFIPGSIIGMLLLFLFLKVRIVPLSWFEHGATTILYMMPLFFIPVTVGIMNDFDFILTEGWPMLLIIILSTFITFVFSGKIVERFLEKNKQLEHKREEQEAA